MTESALQGASLEAMVGQFTTDSARSDATARAVSSTLPPPAPIIKPAFASRAACDARRNSIQSDVARSTEQVTEQFRQGLRAFFYSCLVAAVGAVEQHSQATREGFSFDPKNFLPPAE